MVEYLDYRIERINGLGCHYRQLMQVMEEKVRSLAEKAGFDMASFPTLPPFPFTRPEEDGEVEDAAMEEAQGEEMSSVAVGAQTMPLAHPQPLEHQDAFLMSRLNRLAVYCDDCFEALYQMLRAMAVHAGLDVASFSRPLERHLWLVQEVEEEHAESSVED